MKCANCNHSANRHDEHGMCLVVLDSPVTPCYCDGWEPQGESMTDAPTETKQVIIEVRSWVRREPDKSGMAWKLFTQTVDYPSNYTLAWDQGQRCLTIRDASGQPVAAYAGLVRYYAPDITMGAIEESWSPEPNFSSQ